ncbi:MAG: DUF6788 family protein [Armatimonadota bacterium]
MRGVLRSRMLRCGKKGCRCHTDPAFRHGPYWYLYWRQGKRMRCRYIPPDKVEVFQQAIAARQALNAGIRKAHEDMRNMRWQLKCLRMQLTGVMLEGRALGPEPLWFTAQ